MNSRLLVAGLALLLCVGQARKSGPVLPLTESQIFRVELGGSVRMPCQFSNVDPDVAISWKRDDELLFLEETKFAGDPENRFSRLADNSLEISNANEADGRAKFVCSYLEEERGPNNPTIVHRIEIASAGSDDEGFILVTPSAMNEVEQGANLTLGCEGHRIKLDEETRHSIALRVSNATRHVAGDYQCLVEIGAARPLIKHLKLRVRRDPSQPVFRSGAAVDDSIELQWSVISYKPIVQAEVARLLGCSSRAKPPAKPCPLSRRFDLSSQVVYRKQAESAENWIAAKDVKVVSSLGKEHVLQGRIQGIAPGLYEARARARNDEEHADESQGLAWGPFSDLKKFNGEYKADADAASVRGSAAKPSVSSMTLLLLLLLLLVTSPLALRSRL
ncbi:hypothetical protein TSAR_013451 [Trichomalopsis sarcophagae]|uniref:Ig-like domain-containing protein n=1 Tax=Trichomalopsis sarcophagae TaxID=543379 RepID=A0A232EM67_9HYME|nr:hypothetical protein TSAR_013451 [Trichomalopsis sarcophagae]